MGNQARDIYINICIDICAKHINALDWCIKGIWNKNMNITSEVLCHQIFKVKKFL